MTPVPLPRAHSHNDYEQSRPLLEALDCGYMSVEADVYVVNGELLVAHEEKDVKPERTLRSLYLRPLAELAAKNGGRIYPGQGAVTLMIDFKTDADPTWSALKPQLEEFRDILTEFDGTTLHERAITIIISGERPIKQLAATKSRLAFVDGRPGDLEKKPPATMTPWISSSWTGLFEWRGEGEFPAEEKKKLHDLTDKAHAQGRRVRFWGVPNEPFAWDILTAGGVDILGSDDLPKLRDYLLKPKAGN